MGWWCRVDTDVDLAPEREEPVIDLLARLLRRDRLRFADHDDAAIKTFLFKIMDKAEDV